VHSARDERNQMNVSNEPPVSNESRDKQAIGPEAGA